MIVDSYEVENAAEGFQRDAHPVGAAESAVLAAPFEVRFQVKEDAWNSASLETSLQPGNLFGKVAQDLSMPAIADVCGNKVFQHIFVNMPDRADRPPAPNSP